MSKDTSTKCAHFACSCTVADSGDYCSQYCRDAGKDEVEISCDCGHPGCGITEPAPVEAMELP